MEKDGGKDEGGNDIEKKSANIQLNSKVILKALRVLWIVYFLVN